MEKEFVPYELAWELKQLGFNECCYGCFSGLDNRELRTSRVYTNRVSENIAAPTYSQAFRWFREKYALCIVIKPIDDKKLKLGYNLLKNGLMMGSYLTYEEAELACLQKLIEIVKTK
jgi:hypothetical protein